jgi:hypothetical protein
VRSAVRLAESEAGVEGTDPVLRKQRSMSMKTSAGLQDSGTTDESTAENVEADPDLAELIEQYENTDWCDVPDISAAEADAWTARLIEAREIIQEGL